MHATFPSFYKQFILKVENYVICAGDPPAGSGVFVKKPKLSGKQAVAHLFAILKKDNCNEKRVENADATLLKKCSLFRMFRWCLSVDDCAELDKLVAQGVKNRQAVVPQMALADGKAKDAKGDNACESVALVGVHSPALQTASSSSSSGSGANPESGKKSAVPDHKAAIMRMCSRPVKS